MVDRGRTRLYFKRLAGNDNSKNQIYIGGTPEDTRPLPTGTWTQVLGKSLKPRTKGGQYILQAPVSLSWLRTDGGICAAPETKLIMYPQYGTRGEFRLSGFLMGAEHKPSTLLNSERRGREAGRVLLFGTRDDGSVLGFVAAADSTIARELAEARPVERVGVLDELALPVPAAVATREELLRVLGEIHRLDWTDSKLLNSKRGVLPCKGNQCVGQTLLAELGIPADGRAVADYRGWEVKAFTTPAFASARACRVTLMTPEPNGGYYAENGARGFLVKYGTPSRDPNKIYFEGKHAFGVANRKRKTVLQVVGYDAALGAITDASGGIQLVDADGAVAASWGFAGLIEHWRNKHARAVYVAANSQPGPPQKYRYADYAHLAIGNPFARFMAAFLAGAVFYDPGIRIDNSKGDGKGIVKARSQFRIYVPTALTSLYDVVELRAPVL